LSAPAQRHVPFVLASLLSGGLAPLVEEAYFRGFLLPRMRHWGPMAPVANALLFGVYHFFTPWNLPAVFVAFLPVAFVVQARKNFRISLVVHVLFNLTGVLTLFLGPAG
jgi:membrane protease YdiL (CAAX protease family)